MRRAGGGNTEGNQIADGTNDRKYFSLVPRIVTMRCRNVYDLSLWVAVREVAGEDGECFLSTGDLGALAMMSAGQVSASRGFLIREGLLCGEVRRDPGYQQPVWHLRVPDLWVENVRWCRKHEGLLSRVAQKREQKKSLHGVKPSHGEKGAAPHEGRASHGEEAAAYHEGKNIKEEEPKEGLKEQGGRNPKTGPGADPAVERVWKLVIDQLRMEMPRANFEKYVQDTRPILLKDGVLRVQTTSQYARDWAEGRLTSTAERMLIGALSEQVRVQFVLAAAPGPRQEAGGMEER